MRRGARALVSPSDVTSTSTSCSRWPAVRRCCRPAPRPCRRPASRPASPRARGPTRIYAFPGVPYEFEAMWRAVAERARGRGLLPRRRRAHRAHLRRRRAPGRPAPRTAAARPARDRHQRRQGRGDRAPALPPARGPADARRQRVVAALEAGAPGVQQSTAARSTTSSPTGCAPAGSRSPSPSRAPAVCSAPASRERPGSSDYFARRRHQLRQRGQDGPARRVPAGMLAQYGAVSEEVAGAMAEGARAATGADYALAVTGVAGPGRRHARRSRWASSTWAAPGRGARGSCAASFPGDRAAVREFSVAAALHLLRQSSGRVSRAGRRRRPCGSSWPAICPKRRARRSPPGSARVLAGRRGPAPQPRAAPHAGLSRRRAGGERGRHRRGALRCPRP